MLLGCCVSVEDLGKVRESGFDFAELRVESTLPMEKDAIWSAERKRLLDFQTPILGFNVLLPHGMKIVGDAVSLDTLQSYLDVVFYRMSELGGKHISFGSGGARTVPAGFDKQKAEEQLVEFLTLLDRTAETYGIQINVEFLNRKETNMILNLKEASEYARKINKQSVKILADIYHMMVEKHPISDLFEVRDDIGYVHVADSGRSYPGSGSYPYEEFFSALKEIDYNGPVSVECNWKMIDHEMKESAQFLRKFF